MSSESKPFSNVEAGALAEVLAREAFYESTPALQPLSYKHIAESWSRALLKTYAAKDQASLEKAQREFQEYEVEIVSIIGRVAYAPILLEYQRIIAKRLTSESITPGALKHEEPSQYSA